jgi:BASS family bile acid:Na+ symporter
MKRISIHNLFYLVEALLLVATFLDNVARFFSGHWFGRLLIFHERRCRTIALETEMQNAGLATGLVLTMEKITRAGLGTSYLWYDNERGCFCISKWRDKY